LVLAGTYDNDLRDLLAGMCRARRLDFDCLHFTGKNEYKEYDDYEVTKGVFHAKNSPTQYSTTFSNEVAQLDTRVGVSDDSLHEEEGKFFYEYGSRHVEDCIV
ncbi:hypothetical protein PFISCL1PPCAC_15612, partial [Pristionchus fissidentatus]